MYSTLARFSDPESKKGKKQQIGPSTYTITVPEPDILHNQGFGEGFLTSAKRDLSLAAGCVTPGPNKYEGYLYRSKNVLGGSSLQNKQERKTGVFENIEETPGPGAYDPDKPIEKLEGKGKIIRGHPPRGKGSRGPTIPSHLEKYGYDIDENGNVFKVPLPAGPGGPDYMDPLEKEIHLAEKKYKGIIWSNRTEKRKYLSVKSTSPGPAAYEHLPCSQTFKETIYEYYRQLLARSGKSERYNDKLWSDLNRQAFPSPAEYNITSKKQTRREKMKIPSLPQAERFKTHDKSTNGPGPGAYEDKIYAIKPKVDEKKPKKEIPFLSNNPRFKSEKEYVPNIDLETYKKLFRKVVKADPKKKAVFSSTEERFRFTIQDTPGAEEYTLEDIALKANRRLPRIWGTKQKGFDSSAERFPDRKNYNHPPEVRRQNRYKRFNESVEKKVKIKNKFEESRKCCKDIARIFFHPQIDPGPATYNTGVSCIRKGVSIARAITERGGVLSDYPGPGTYTLSKELAQPFLNTHNVKLKSGIERWKKPKHRPKIYTQMVTGRKRLWIFTDPELKCH